MHLTYIKLLGYFRSIYAKAGKLLVDEKINTFPKYRWRLSLSKVYDEDDAEYNITLTQANKYLIRMYKRIDKKISAGDIEGAWKVHDLICRRSRSFALFILNKVIPDWFISMDYEQVAKLIGKYLDVMRKKEHRLTVRRTYIPKKNGKVRPLGAPVKEHRMAMAAITEFINIYAMKKIGSYQYGFVPGRSSYQIGERITQLLVSGVDFWEFDLSGFFNRVNFQRVLTELPFGSLSRWLLNISTFTVPTLSLMEEKWHESDMEFRNLGKVAYKQGFTQGSPYSPILCALALELAGFGDIPGLLMYADDGLLPIDKRTQESLKKLEQEEYGIFIAKDKNYGPVAPIFSFLGWSISKESKSITVELKNGLKWTRTFKEILKDMTENKSEVNKAFFGKSIRYQKDQKYKCDTIHYGDGTQTWNWKVHKDSALMLAPDCNFTLKDAKRLFIKVDGPKEPRVIQIEKSETFKELKYDLDLYLMSTSKDLARRYPRTNSNEILKNSIISAEEKLLKKMTLDGNTQNTKAIYRDMSNIRNWCNANLLNWMSKMHVYELLSVSERFYSGNPLVDRKNLSFKDSDGTLIVNKNFAKGDQLLTEHLHIDEHNIGAVKEKFYSDDIVDSLKDKSILKKIMKGRARAMSLKSNFYEAFSSSVSMIVPEIEKTHRPWVRQAIYSEVTEFNVEELNSSRWYVTGSRAGKWVANFLGSYFPIYKMEGKASPAIHSSDVSPLYSDDWMPSYLSRLIGRKVIYTDGKALISSKDDSQIETGLLILKVDRLLSNMQEYSMLAEKAIKESERILKSTSHKPY